MKILKNTLLYGLFFMATGVHAMNEESLKNNKKKSELFLAVVQHHAQNTDNNPKCRDEAYDTWLQLNQAGIKNHVPYVTKPTLAEMQVQLEKKVDARKFIKAPLGFVMIASGAAMLAHAIHQIEENDPNYHGISMIYGAGLIVAGGAVVGYDLGVAQSKNECKRQIEQSRMTLLLSVYNKELKKKK